MVGVFTVQKGDSKRAQEEEYSAIQGVAEGGSQQEILGGSGPEGTGDDKIKSDLRKTKGLLS
jgi:hypothetical protein